MKGDIYKYENKEFVLEGKYFDTYLDKTGVKLDVLYSPKEATNIINSNVLPIYKGIFTCRKYFNGKEICNLLARVQEEFEIRIDVVCGEE